MNKIVANNKLHLLNLIRKEIEDNGHQCDLNHIDVSKIKDMRSLFQSSKFNGNISQWDVSGVKDMKYMFHMALFKNDISQWDVSSVENMSGLFRESVFSGNISNWDVSNVKDMLSMFSFSKFNKNISQWNALKVKDIKDIFYYCNTVVPYWAQIDDLNERQLAIKNFHLKQKLESSLVEKDIIINDNIQAKPKI